jgi:hypothetical protein
MDEYYYLYAVTWANVAPQGLPPGVDPRFPVEIVPCGQVAGLASRVGLDQFHPEWLQAESADVARLSEVALRHNAIVDALAGRSATLPLRLGALFQSRQSLVARLARCEAEAVEFLRRLADRQEWAVKVYLADDGGLSQFSRDPAGARNGTVPSGNTENEPVAAHSAPPAAAPLGGSTGTQYLAAKRGQAQRRRQVQVAARQEVSALEEALQPLADSWRQLRVLPTTLTGRTEKMVSNGAFLVSRARQRAFHAACDQLRGELQAKGLIVEVTGPWPAYHFCPALQQ